MSAHRKEFCTNGHPRTAENLTKARNCKVCQRARVSRFTVADPRRYTEKAQARNKKYRQQLTNSYVNLLIHAKTGIPYNEITEEDRAERRRIILEYRERKALKEVTK